MEVLRAENLSKVYCQNAVSLQALRSVSVTIQKGEFVAILTGFIRLNSSSALISMETDDFKIEGTKGNWIAADETIVDGKQFFLLQNDIYKDDVPYVVVSEEGKVVTDESRGFDETTLQKIRDFMCPPEKPVPVSEKPQMEQWQKYYENGEYLRSAEMTEEQNYNMIDGRLNNISGKKQADVLNACVGAKIAVKEGEEAIDVCLAIQQMNEEAAQKERVSTLLQSIKNLMDNLGLTAEQAMNAMGVSETDRKSILPFI